MGKPDLTREQAENLRARFLQMIDAAQFKCTSCGYCMPCPLDIDLPEIFKAWNQAHVLGIAESAGKLKHLSGNKDNCTKCGECESKCPNQLNIIKMLEVI